MEKETFEMIPQLQIVENNDVQFIYAQKCYNEQNIKKCYEILNK